MSRPFIRIHIYQVILVSCFIVTMTCQFGSCLSADQLKPETTATVDISAAGLKAAYLRCEYHVNPLGIGVVQPRLSWIVVSDGRTKKQSAYRILVSSDRQKLDAGEGDLWDSGRVCSHHTNQVVYGGKKLLSRMRCFWQVRVWDGERIPSAYSPPALWTMGLLDTNDWQAKWIGFDLPTPPSHRLPPKVELFNLRNSMWVWSGRGNPQQNVSPTTLFFRKKISLDSEKKIKKACFYLAVDDELTLFVNDKEMARFRGWKPRKKIDLTDVLIRGENILAIVAENSGVWPTPAGLIGKLYIEFQAGDNMVVPIDNSWKVNQEEHTGWLSVEFNDSSWPQAREFAPYGDQPWGELTDSLHLPPPPYLRKIFSIRKPIKQATIYTSALGLYELHINGRRVGINYFTPGWTDYKKRIYYNTYDVTHLLRNGSNALGAILADGWYAGYIGWGNKRDRYSDQPRFLAQLEIEFADGSKRIVFTDKTWKAAYGPILEADILMGEAYDARLEMPGWDTASFNDSSWQPVALSQGIDVEVQAYPGVTVKEHLGLKPKRITQPAKETYIVDLGQNIAGWARLKFKGKAGDRVTLRFAEVLNPDGTIYTDNLRNARATDTYILKGTGEEIWQPRFTYHGFRYIEVSGYPGKLSEDSLTGIVVHSDTAVSNSFECSSSMINQLYQNVAWSQRGNFIDVPTDCPQRDERLGWTGDAQIFSRTAALNMDVAAFFTKWLVDLVDAQGEDGNFPDVAPRIVATGGGTAACGDAGIICPWTMYQVYGDTHLVEKHYGAMQKWIEFLTGHSEHLLRPATGYGDWLSIAADTPKDVVATAYFAYSTRLLSKMAEAIGQKQDAQDYELLFQNIKAAFVSQYITADARIKGDTQTGYVLALYFDLLPENKRLAAVNHLIEKIKAKNWHLSTGFIGSKYLLSVLTDAGHLDVAYRLLNNDTFPSWGYCVKQGATTIWERWDGLTNKGFQSPEMNSFNHFAFGAVASWMFSTIIGIDTDGPGFRKIIIHPQPGGGLIFARGTYNSINGQVISDWKITGQKFHLNVTIPANTTATIYLPSQRADSVTESGIPAQRVQAIRFIRWEKNTAVFQVSSGKYQFLSLLPK
ncbi:family 78 glycoside hydrolase catalytic domain [candidate division CSSED10-310 bacterium]|uniref:alpha-L-rhamnosidase n=1 Tax=candidate division CSSED10-310 bacterium TaxID=2855610 RepID=A0ABV6YQT5_UNCC1